MKRHTVFNRLAGAGLIGAVLALAVVPAALAEPVGGKKNRRAGFDLMRAASTWVMRVNRVECGMDNQGNICTDTFGSPTGGGGNWPAGSPDQYIFNSGLQIAGIISQSAGIWAGDTVGAYFFDARGTQPQGQQVTLIYSSLNPADAANWPNGAVIRDASIYNPALIGRPSISQEDTWVRYWDGPGLLSGRQHPMGILVEQRGLAWNYPAGNEDIIYWIFTFYNISASDPAAYSALDPGIQSEIAGLGASWVAETESRLGVDIPAGGYRIDSVFAAFAMDPDVGNNFRVNASTAILPFDMGLAYNTAFDEPTWLFPPDIFSPPFGAFPGFVGVKYLKSPLDLGLSLFSNTTNSAQFPDPVGVSQLWRYLSGRIDPGQGDPVCDVNPPIQRKLCALRQQPDDTRFYQSSGPFSLDPGQSASIVVAYVHAAPIGAVVAPYFKQNPGLQPGIPPTGTELVTNPALLRDIERAAGWISATDGSAGTPANGSIEQEEVVSHRFSLLDKSLVAQTLFDAQFLLPFAPEPPDFYLVPGNKQVTVVWQPSLTETVGDPFFDLASVPGALFDANYRDNDVEGYRIYRGRTRAQLTLIAQFDYSGTTFKDYTGNWAYDGRCYPEQGILDDCPANFPLTPGVDNPVEHELVGEIPQVLDNKRLVLADGSVIIPAADRINAVEDAGFPALANTGVPFAFVDNSVLNSLTYFYAVSAFDVNSARSGPPSLESTLQAKAVVPRAPSPNVVQAALTTGLFGDDDVELNPIQPFSIDAATGRFSGSPPPTPLEGLFAPLVPDLLPALDLQFVIDSVNVIRFDDARCASGGNALGSCYLIFSTFSDGTNTMSSVIEQPWPVWAAFGDPHDITATLGAFAVDADQTSAARYGIPAGFSRFNAAVDGLMNEYIYFSGFEGQSSRRGLDALNPSFSPGGSRWFEGANETVDHPTSSIRVGTLAGVDSVWSPIHHTDIDPVTPGAQTYGASGQIQCFGYMHGGLDRQADIQFTWGAGGTIASVRDLTHRVDVPFSSLVAASYGFVGDLNADGVVSWRDFDNVENVAFNLQALGFCASGEVTGATGRLTQNPTIGPVSTSGDRLTPPQTGVGFGLYVAGHRFIFELAGGTPPADGTQWTLRSYSGIVSASGDDTATPSGYSYAPAPPSISIPGLRVTFSVAAPTSGTEVTDATLENVHTVPDPYYVTSALEITPSQKVIRFVNLPPQAIIRIYSLSGVLVNVLEHNDAALGGEATWNVRNRNQQYVASGVYFYHLETPTGAKKIGRFTVINSGNLVIQTQ